MQNECEIQNPKSSGFWVGAVKQKTETTCGGGEFLLLFIFSLLHLLIELADSKTKMDTI